MSQLQRDSQEVDEIARNSILLIAGGVIALSGLLVLVARAELALRRSTFRGDTGVAVSPRPVDGVSNVRTRLFVEPAAGELLAAHQRAELSRYQWVDRKRGLVRIPIDVAIDLELEEKR